MKTTYIEKAQEVYEKILNKDIEIYKFFIESVLKSLEIKNHYQLDILSNCLNTNDSKCLCINFNDGGKYNLYLGKNIIKYDISFKDDFKNIKIDKRPEQTVHYIDLTKHELYQQYSVDDVPGVNSLIATLEIWEVIQRKYKIDNIEQLSYTSEELRSVFKRSFGEYCLSYMWENSKQELHHYCDAITLLFFIFLWKSITIGEFYIVPDYENKIHLIKEDSEETIPKILPAFISYYPEICTLFNTFINRIRPYDKKDDGIVYNLDTNPKTIANKVIDTYSNLFIETKMLKPLIILTEQLFEITVIDLNYSTSEKTIAKLVDFISSLDIFTQSFNPERDSNAQSAAIHLAHFDPSALKIFENVIELLLYKTSILTKQIIQQTEKVISNPKARVQVICDKYRLANDRINNIIDKYSLGTYDEDPFYSLFCNYKNKDLDLSSIQSIRTNKKKYADSWWVKYNTNIDYAIELRKTNSNLLNSINYRQGQPLAEIQQFVERQRNNKNKFEYKYTSPSTYINAIVWLYDYIVQRKDDENRLEIRLFEELLKCFRRYINMYKNINCVPQTFRSYFEYSFCAKEGDTLKKTHIDMTSITGENTLMINDCIFFASIGYQPFNVESLETCFYFYNLELKSFEREALDASLTAIKQANAERKKSIRQYNTVKKQANEITDQIEKERSKTLQLVGLLGVFIAFVSSTVGTQTVATDIRRFTLFAFTFLAGILIFIFSIRFITQKKFEWGKIDTANTTIIILLIIGIIVGVCKIMPSETENRTQTGAENIKSAVNQKQNISIYTSHINDTDCPQDSCNDIVNRPAVVKKDTSANKNSDNVTTSMNTSSVRH